MAIHILCSHDSIDEHQRSITTNRFFFSSTKATTGASLRLLSTTMTSVLGDPATETSLLPRASTGASLCLLTTTITFFLEIPPLELLSFLEPPLELLFGKKRSQDSNESRGDRRHKRMIKNRESVAHSRSRKQ
ncbi:bZIP transcription factor 27-like, partial [Brassica napus]|uniref:bZIP transcription factor 27-like n=1 Tax=Brassica napus TaxID=3708 RepID=UPI0020788487